MWRDILLAAGTRMTPNIGSDIAKPGVVEVSYPATPVACVLSLCEGLDRLQPVLGDIRCPVLIMTSREDHVVPPVSSDVLADRVSGSVERVFLDRSYHVATLDHDRHEIEARAVEFARKVTAG
jgi:carboxylesterase